MSDVMFYGVLRMPYEMAMGDELSRAQFYGRAQEAADRIERLERELDRARSAYQGCASALEIANREQRAFLEHGTRPAQSIDSIVQQIVAYGAACLCQDDRASAIMERIKRELDGRTAGTAPQAVREGWHKAELPWSEYPEGTKARESWAGGGFWLKTERGWKWHLGGTFPTPGSADEVLLAAAPYTSDGGMTWTSTR